jgi:prepilin-type processing-associated H-X9-DG protein
LVPPLGFAMVAPGVYRCVRKSTLGLKFQFHHSSLQHYVSSSGHPNHCNFAFLDGLQLKSIMQVNTHPLLHRLMETILIILTLLLLPLALLQVHLC